MCFRYAFYGWEVFERLFAVNPPEGILGRYNIAPTEVLAAVARGPKGVRELRFFQWGLVPSWAKDPDIARNLINARCETLHEKPAFRAAFKRRRILIPASGFYEWKGPAGSKQPYYFKLKDEPVFAIAGLWEEWERPEGLLQTCTIVTTEPNELVAEFHTRMPVIIDRSDYAQWLDPGIEKVAPLMPLYQPFPARRMEAYAVDKRMSNPRYDEPDCVEPLAPGLF